MAIDKVGIGGHFLHVTTVSEAGGAGGRAAQELLESYSWQIHL